MTKTCENIEVNYAQNCAIQFCFDVIMLKSTFFKNLALDLLVVYEKSVCVSENSRSVQVN